MCSHFIQLTEIVYSNVIDKLSPSTGHIQSVQPAVLLNHHGLCETKMIYNVKRHIDTIFCSTNVICIIILNI